MLLSASIFDLELISAWSSNDFAVHEMQRLLYIEQQAWPFNVVLLPLHSVCSSVHVQADISCDSVFEPCVRRFSYFEVH